MSDSSNPFQCVHCHQTLGTMDDLFSHYHNTHNEPYDKTCPCSTCLRIFKNAPQSHQDPQIVGGTSKHIRRHRVRTIDHGVTLLTPPVANHLAHPYAMPMYMGKIECGSMVVKHGEKFWVVEVNRPPDLVDANGNRIRGIFSGKNKTDVAFLPHTISNSTRPWQLGYWTRRAAEEGIDLEYADLLDRCPLVELQQRTSVQNLAQLSRGQRHKESNRLSTALQRYNCNLGLLPIVASSTDYFPSVQAICTIEHLLILQGELNTTWLPSPISKDGPWIVSQPQSHPAIDNAAGLPLQTQPGTQYVIALKYGLSDRLKYLSDALLFAQMRADERNVELACSALLGDIVSPPPFVTWKDIPSQYRDTIDDDFEHWRECHKVVPAQEVLDEVSQPDVSQPAIQQSVLQQVNLQSKAIAALPAQQKGGEDTRNDRHDSAEVIDHDKVQQSPALNASHTTTRSLVDINDWSWLDSNLEDFNPNTRISTSINAFHTTAGINNNNTAPKNSDNAISECYTASDSNIGTPNTIVTAVTAHNTAQITPSDSILYTDYTAPPNPRNLLDQATAAPTNAQDQQEGSLSHDFDVYGAGPAPASAPSATARVPQSRVQSTYSVQKRAGTKRGAEGEEDEDVDGMRKKKRCFSLSS